MSVEKNDRRIIMYLAIAYGCTLIGWLLALLLPEPYNNSAKSVLILCFSLFPLIATFVTRKMTNDKMKLAIKPHFRKNWKVYLMAAFLPGVAIFLGAMLYFLIFPNDLDLSGKYLIAHYAQYGVPTDIHLTVAKVIRDGIMLIFISPLIFPFHIAAFGEEIGWRGYLLPLLLKKMEQRKAIILNGALWGLGHGPLIYLGFNYGSGYWGAPFTGIIMMTLVGIVCGVLLSYVTLKSESVIPASILHGSMNVIGEFPIAVAASSASCLLGPNPTGIIGMSGLIVCASVCLIKLSNQKGDHNSLTGRIKNEIDA
jgi:uncharacterized protein